MGRIPRRADHRPALHNLEELMMSDHDLSRKLTDISRDAKPRMSNPEAEMDYTRTPAQPTRSDGGMWSMWPMYLCFGMLLVILAFSVLPRWL
jgi:hypothetical protein